MRIRIPISFIILLSALHSAATAQWVHQTTFPASGRMEPFCFVVNDKAYIGSGYDASFQATVDNHEYDHSTNSWTTKKVPPFAARMGAFSFSIGQYGYVGSGSTNGGANVLTDFWRYDPATDVWTQMAAFPGVGRIEAATFVINNRGYVVGGVRSAGNPADCWEYDPAANAWTQKSNPPAGFTPGYVAGFTDGTFGYCGIGGWNSNCQNDFWRFNPATNTWTQMASLPSPLRTFNIGGVNLMNGKGFVGLGGCTSVANTDFWTYDAAANSWQSSAAWTFPLALANARGFVAGGSLYVGTGGKAQGTENRIFRYVREESCVAPPAGMTGWWPLDETQVSPGSGVQDLTGDPTAYSPTTFANTGVVVGAVTAATGKVAGGFNFSGAGNDYVMVPDQADLNVGTGDFTIDAWVKPKEADGIRVIADKRTRSDLGQTTGWSFFTYSGALGIQMGDQSGAFSNFIAPSSSKLNAGSWYHVAAAVERNNPQGGRLYVNGQLVHTFNPTARSGSLSVRPPLYIARSIIDSGTINRGFSGVIDEVELFRRALSAGEIAALFDADAAGKCKQNADSCCVRRESISTGWDHATGSTAAIGSPNSFWQVTVDPSSSTTEPRPANIVHPYNVPLWQAWRNPLPASRWITASTGSSYAFAVGTYEFRACLCLCERPRGSRLRLVMDIRSDNAAQIFIGGSGTPILTTPSNSYAQLNPSHFDDFIDTYVTDSTTTVCLTIRVQNDGGPMGLNVSGHLEAVDAAGNPYPGVEKVVCCSAEGVINGTKFLDRDCDGARDTGEPALPGWTITAQGSQGSFSATTDATGAYQIAVPAGTYTLTENSRPGWVQCSPQPPANQVTVTGGGTATVDFGNNHLPPDRCFLADSIRTVCRFDSTTGTQYYDLTASLRSFLDCNNAPQFGQVIAASSNTGAITVTPGGTFPVSTSPLQHSFALSGSGATPGAVVRLVVRVCCASHEPGYERYCCTDTIVARLPDQPCAPEGCLEIVDDSVHCAIGPDGTARWNYCFRVRNRSFFPASYLTLGGAGLSFTPSTVSLGTLAPGAVSGTYCVTVNASGPGFYSLNALMQNARRTLRCEMKLRLELPDCPSVSCCPGFAKFDASLKPWASSSQTSAKWGNAGMNGTLTAVGRDECRRMTKVEATIEHASINNQPTYAYFASSFVWQQIGGLGAGTVTTTPYGQRVVWGPMTPRIVSGPTSLRLVFPPRKGAVETLRWCVRYRFTDECCNTCDTLICYTVTRRKPVFPWPPVKGSDDWFRGNEKESEGNGIQGAPSIGQLVPPDSSTMTLTLPDVPGARYTGMMITALDSGVTLRDVTPARPDLLFLTPDGTAVADFDLAGDIDLTLGLKYDDYGDRASIRHAVSIFYRLDSAPEEQQEMGGEITLYRSGSEGGDVVAPNTPEPEVARTVALHLENANRSGRPIARVALRVRSGHRILAVGPTADDSTAVVSLRKVDDRARYIATEGRGAEVVVPAGGSVDPIYLTVEALKTDSIVVDFVTLDEEGEAISDGTFIVGPFSGIDDDGGGVTGMLLLQSYPNPTDGSATIEFALPRSDRNVTMIVTDAKGNEVARLIDGAVLHAGLHAVRFDGTGLPSGTYFYTLSTARGTETGRLQLVR